MPADYRIGQQFFLMQDPELKWQVRVERGNIQRRRVIDRIDVRPGSIYVFETDDLHGRENRLHGQARPGPRERMEDAAIAIKKAERNGRYPKSDRIKPDQRIKEEIRAQMTEKAVFLAGWSLAVRG